MRKFDYGFLENGLLPSKLLDTVASIYSLRVVADNRKIENINIFTELEKIAIIQSIKSSNEIEGIVTSDERISQIVKNKVEPLNHNEAEIAGYRDALALIHSEHNSLDFTIKDILRLHSIIFSYHEYENAGKFKKNDNLIIELDSEGHRKIRFRPTPASETVFAMEQLELAYIEARDNNNINKLLLIPCLILDFLCIHPFSDGNGRMSRLLSLLLLYRNNYEVGKYISYEKEINNYKHLYYTSLKESSIDWHENNNDYMPFISNFLSTLYMCYKELNKRFAVIGDKKISKKTRVEGTVLNSLVPISKSEIHEILPDVSITTIEAVLGEMVKRNQIKKVGKGRNTRYIKY